MNPRINFVAAAPAGSRALYSLDTWVRKSSGLDPALLELVRLRASQTNGCAYCLDMYSKDVLALGENEQRLHVLSAWRDAPFYTDRERARCCGPSTSHSSARTTFPMRSMRQFGGSSRKKSWST